MRTVLQAVPVRTIQWLVWNIRLSVSATTLYTTEQLILLNLIVTWHVLATHLRAVVLVTE